MKQAVLSIHFINKNYTNNHSKDKEGKAIRHISFYTSLIQTLGYDPLCAILEVRLSTDGKIRRYTGVPEGVWYQLRDNIHPDTYFRRNVCGRFSETLVTEEKTS